MKILQRHYDSLLRQYTNSLSRQLVTQSKPLQNLNYPLNDTLDFLGFMESI